MSPRKPKQEGSKAAKWLANMRTTQAARPELVIKGSYVRAELGADGGFTLRDNNNRVVMCENDARIVGLWLVDLTS